MKTTGYLVTVLTVLMVICTPTTAERLAVKIEAVVVDCSTESLFDNPQAQLDQGPEAITLPKLIWCLEAEETARIAGECMLTLYNFEQSAAVTKEQTSMPLKKKVTGKNDEYHIIEYRDMINAVEFEARIVENDPQSVVIKYTYEQSKPDMYFDEDLDSSIFNRLEFHWRNTAALKYDVPQIAASTQYNDRIYFLVLWAILDSRPETPTRE